MDPNEIDDLYRDAVLDHCRNPRNHREIAEPTLSGRAVNPFCGDEVTFTMGLDAEGRIGEVGVEGQGCSISQASASMLSDHLKGKTLDEAEQAVRTFKGIMQGEELTDELEEELGEIAALQGVRKFPIRVKCALLGWTTLQDAIAEYRKTHAD